MNKLRILLVRFFSKLKRRESLSVEHLIREKINKFIEKCIEFEKEICTEKGDIKEEYQETVLDKYLDLFADIEKEISTDELGIIVEKQKETVKRYFIAYYILDERIFRQLNEKMKDSPSWKLEAQIRLYMMFLKTFREILSLLSSGFSNCALARTRTLYELGVYISLINKHSEELSERFCKYCNVQSLNIAKAMSFKDKKDKLIEVINAFDYETEFTFENGWARILFNDTSEKKYISFKDLAELTTFNKYYPMYKVSCNFVHGNLFSSLQSLDSAKEERGKNFWNTSPSNEGIREVVLFLKIYIPMLVINYTETFEDVKLLETMINAFLLGKEILEINQVNYMD